MSTNFRLYLTMTSDLCPSAFCHSLVPCLQSMGGAFSTLALGKQVPFPMTFTVCPGYLS